MTGSPTDVQNRVRSGSRNAVDFLKITVRTVATGPRSAGQQQENDGQAARYDMFRNLYEPTNLAPWSDIGV